MALLDKLLLRGCEIAVLEQYERGVGSRNPEDIAVLK